MQPSAITYVGHQCCKADVRNRTASYQNKVDLNKQFSMEPDRLLPRGSSK